MSTRVRPRDRWVHSVSLGSPGLAPGVVGFIRCRCVDSGWPWVSLGLSGVVGFIRGHWVHSGSHWGLFGSSGVVGFTQERPGDRLVHPGSLDSLGFALGVAWFIRGRWVSLEFAPGVV